MFANGSTLVTGGTNFEIQQRAQKLLDTVAQFADFAATALNLGKSFATGRDFGREQELHVRLTFRGDIVPFVPSGQSFRCLGVQFNCRLTGTVIALSDIWRVRQAARASHPATHPGPPPVTPARAPVIARALTP